MQAVLDENNCLRISDLAIDGHDMLALGLSGPAIGNCLQQLLDEVIDEKIPNERAALLAAAERISL